MLLLDDHLLRDWLASPDAALRRAIRRDDLATTNLWYARLCKSAAGQKGGALLGGWDPNERNALVAALISLPDEIEVVPMRRLAWRMGQLISGHSVSLPWARKRLRQPKPSTLVSWSHRGMRVRACAERAGPSACATRPLTAPDPEARQSIGTMLEAHTRKWPLLAPARLDWVEVAQRTRAEDWSGRRDSNPRPSPWQGDGFRPCSVLRASRRTVPSTSFQPVHWLRRCSRAFFYRRDEHLPWTR